MQPGDKIRAGFLETTRLKEELSRGSGGTIWRLDDDRYLLKAPHVFDEERQRHIEWLSRYLARTDCTWPAESIAGPAAIYSLDGKPLGFTLHHFREEDGWVPFEFLLYKTISLTQKLALAKRLASAVVLIHSRNLVIGDFNPSNLLGMEDASDLAFIDVDSWGYAPPQAATFGGIDMKVNQPISPSQIPRAKYMPGGLSTTIDRQTDEFALGIIALQILTGEHPFGPSQVTVDSDTLSNLASWSSWLSNPSNYRLDQDKFPAGKHPGLDVFPEGKAADLADEGGLPGGSLRQCALRLISSGSVWPSAAEWLMALAFADVTTCPDCGSDQFVDGVCPMCVEDEPGSSRRKRLVALLAVAVVLIVVGAVLAWRWMP